MDGAAEELGAMDGHTDGARPPSPRLSRPHSEMRERYDVVVVGSGYGGAITASRLARAGRSVCVLERGREIRAGEFPDNLLQAARQVQVQRGSRRLGSRTGLFDLRAGGDLSVVVGCGLGGTSLINAGVSLRPPAWVFDDERWPSALRLANGGPAELDPYFAAAERMLGATPYPDHLPTPSKLTVLERAAAGAATATGAPVAAERVPVNVSFAAGPNAAGVEQAPCILCGDCVTGCNHRAKNTVAENYLPDAVAHGAEVYCSAAVRTVEPADGRGGGWLVSFDAVGDGRPRFAAPSSFVFADVVVLAAGSLGSTEILLRSQARGLAVSPRLGDRFTGNGDVLAFAYDVHGPPPLLRGIGTGRRRPAPGAEVGPCITGRIDLTAVPEPGRGMTIEEGAIPGALRPVMPAAFAVAADLDGGGGPLAFARRLARRLRATAGAVLDPTGGPADRSLTYLVMSDDVGDGRLCLDGRGVRVDWPAVGDLPIFDQNAEVIQAATTAAGGEYVANPLWSPTFGESLVTVHPLGGCAMADDGAHGVVDHRGRVFTGTGDEVHDGLLVADGAIVPRPLAVNPLLTISALAERAVALLAGERGWPIATGPTPPLDGDRAPDRPGLRFTERMAGWAGAVADGDPHRGARQGEADGTRIEFVLTIDIDDLPAMIDDPATPGRLSGTVTIPSLSPRRLRVVEGTFRLAQEDPSRVDTWLMRYRMRLVSDDGRHFDFDGHKVLHDRFGFDVWGDTTTLYVTVRDDAGRPAVAGIMRIAPGDLARQASTMRVTGVAGRAERLRWTGRFLCRFVKSLDHVYGSLDDVGRFPAQPARPVPLTGAGRRKLRLPAPEPRWCDAEGRWHEGDQVGDGAWLRLTRYEGGRRGPVLLAAGFGMSATSFLLDTVPTNLTEHLVDAGYDVWLLDYRASIDLPSARTAFTLDDIATADWPAAVAAVRRVTGAGSVQALGHCVGSVSLMMALAAGLTDVRSAVCMQFTLHPVTSPLNQFKAAAGIDRLMRGVGVRLVAPLTGGSGPNHAVDTGLDLLLRSVPMPRAERCGKALCRWINAIYGCTHAHDQLNDATHDALDDLFGVGNLAALSHMSTIMQRRLAVDAAGRDVYTARPDRVRLPVLLVQGERNYIFRPAGSVRTLRWLQTANEPSLYERAVLPGYAHLDALIGRDASTDVFPVLSGHLDRFNR
ncbi:MAG TPA: GMC family oxidoreductase N-terminal domain-containing protein [Acidimicrobiales bacterium]